MLQSFNIIENYLDIYYNLKQIELSGYIKFAQNELQKNILIIYFEKDQLQYFNKISSLYKGKITLCCGLNSIYYSISLYDVYILEYLSTFYSIITQKRNNQLYNDYIYLYNNQFKYLNTKKCNEIQYMI